MIELLSLPRRQNLVISIPGIKFKSGLPINSLPGWEHIPLNSKLPMLKCPDNQVIFSKNKIGQSIRNNRDLKHEFDPSGRETLPEYNALHDSNLKTFYANERNLKRLRENGEITQNNDVICNLKDFNEYRQKLHKSQLYYILQNLHKLEQEQHDRMLIANAEQITNEDHKKFTTRRYIYSNIRQRKADLDIKRAERCQRAYEVTKRKLLHAQLFKLFRNASFRHKRSLQLVRTQKHKDACNDLQRKRLISLKKLFQFKKDRLKKNLRIINETRAQLLRDKQYASWSRRLAERIANQKKINVLLEEERNQRRIFIENHKNKYREKWERIQMEIRKRSQEYRRRGKPKRKLKKTQEKLCEESPVICAQGNFEKLFDDELCAVLETVQNLENNIQVPFDADDPIYKAARYIMNHILKKFDKDLSGDKEAFQNIYNRLSDFFLDAKKFVTYRATQIISSKRQHNTLSERTNSVNSRVSFSYFSNTIGTSSYTVHPLIDLKDPNSHKKTPPGSLESVVIDSTERLVHKTQMDHLSHQDLVFIEHYLIKFKRKLIVGLGRRVFSAIECHFGNKIMDVRQELLDIDQKFLLKQVARSILSYAVNPLNFESNLRLCINALSSDIIWSLQQQLLKPARDPRRIVKAKLCTDIKHKNANDMCFYCDGN